MSTPYIWPHVGQHPDSRERRDPAANDTERLARDGWPSGCTRNCNQGRMCDCVPDVPEPSKAASMRHAAATVRALKFVAALLAVVAFALLMTGAK